MKFKEGFILKANQWKFKLEIVQQDMQKFNEYLEKFTAFIEKANEDTGVFAENCTRVEIDQ